MKYDPKSNLVLAAAIVAADIAAGAVNSASVDHMVAPSVSFMLNVGAVGASGTVDVKSQYSDDDSAWTDYPNPDDAENDPVIPQIVATGAYQINVPNPRARYTRIVATVAVANVTFGVTSVLGPLRHVDEG